MLLHGERRCLLDRLRLTALAWVLASIHVEAGGISIDHKATDCVEAGKFPRLEARFDPAASVTRARVYFRPTGGPQWYWVPMSKQGPSYWGVLPKPQKKLKRIDYYISALDASFGESRTPEYAPSVVSAATCGGSKMMALAVAKASQVLVAGPGTAAGVSAPLVPAGFASEGVVAVAPAAGGASAAGAGAGAAAGAGGGGLSATTLAIVGGVVAGGAVVVAKATGGGSSDGPNVYSGPYSGQLVAGPIQGAGCSFTQVHSGTVTMSLSSTGPPVAGDGRITGTTQVIADSGPCAPTVLGETGGDRCDFTVSGSPSSIQGHGTFADPSGGEVTCTFFGSFSGDAIAGTMTLSKIDRRVNLTGSASFPVTMTRQ